jgi:hypothetical protein
VLRSSVRDFYPDRAPMFGVLADVLSRFVPEQCDLLHLSFALADANRLKHMFASAGFREVRVERVPNYFVAHEKSARGPGLVVATG